jgi:hypothetical protein
MALKKLYCLDGHLTLKAFLFFVMLLVLYKQQKQEEGLLLLQNLKNHQINSPKFYSQTNLLLQNKN